jgi:hypothetical protein
MQLTDSYRATNQEELSQIESYFNINLPIAYKEFLLKNNGGSPTLHDYKIGGEYFDDVGWFFCIRNSETTHDLKTENVEMENRIPNHYFCIAISFGGNIICLSLKEKEYGFVYRWDHEIENYDGNPWEDNMLAVAASLPDFLDMLYSETNQHN